MKSVFVRFVREDAGQDLIEYALLAGLISVGAIAVMGPLATKISGTFSTITSKLP